MAVDVTTLLAPPTGSGELERRWFDWIRKNAEVLERLDGFRAAGEGLVADVAPESQDYAVTAYVYWKAFDLLDAEYARRIGSMTLPNEGTMATGTATPRGFRLKAKYWRSEWNRFVPDAGPSVGGGVTASVRSHFEF